MELIAMKIKILKTVGALLVLTLKDGKQMKEAWRANKTRCDGVIFRAGKRFQLGNQMDQLQSD